MTSTNLDCRDIEALLRVQEALADPCTVDELRRRAVEAIHTVVESTLTAWNELDPMTNEMFNPVISPAPLKLVGGSMDEGHAIFAAYAHQHPVLQYQIRTGDGRPYAISDFCTQDQFHATELYQRFYQPLGVEEQLALQLPHPGIVVASHSCCNVTENNW